MTECVCAHTPRSAWAHEKASESERDEGIKDGGGDSR